MTPYKHKHGASFELDRRFRGIGRVRVASGTDKAGVFQLLNAMLTELATTDTGRAVLAAIRDRELAPLDVWGAYRAKRLDSLPTGALAQPLLEAVRAWRESTKTLVSDDTYRVRAELLTAIERYGAKDARVADLATVLRRARESMAGAPTSVRLNRAYAQAFVRDTLGKHHPLHAEVSGIPLHKVRRRRQHPLTPAAAVALLAQLKPARRRETVAMLLTGMNPKEYWADWSVRADRVHVEGTKRGGRVRDLPRAFPCALWPHHTLPHPTGAWHPTFQRAFRTAARALGVRYTPYDLRRSFAVWMEEAGIVRARRNIYRGHEARDIGDLYERQEVKAHLVKDGARLVEWINAQLAGNADLEAIAR